MLANRVKVAVTARSVHVGLKVDMCDGADA
jgi:hypothetical protein